MHILYGETHYQGAHRDWIDGFRARSKHDFTLLTMAGGDWRWRLHGGAVHLAHEFLHQKMPPVDLILLNAMVNAPLFLASIRPHLSATPLAVYFQENQLTYPSPPDEPFLWQNGASINVMSAYVADYVFFNGDYLQHDFLSSLAEFVDARGDYPVDIVERIRGRVGVLRRGIDLINRFGQAESRTPPQAPLTVLWSHRWAAEKGVAEFAEAVLQLHAEDLPFNVILAGNPWDHVPLKNKLLHTLGDRVLLHGLLRGDEYVQALRQSDICVIASLNEPLGVSLIEAMYMGCFPVLPNRGSFPYILPAEHHDLLYEDDLVGRLRHLLTHPAEAYRPSLQAIAAEYDWSRLIQNYDEQLETIVLQSGA